MADEARVWFNVRSPMRDGVELANNVYFPPAGPSGGPYPVIFSRNPYGRQRWAEVYRWRFFTDHGYVMVTQDCRGRFDSDGEFRSWVDDGPDGHDAIEWIAAQPWCTGKVGMMGGSYGGWTQWAAAQHRPPHLTAIVSSCAAGRWGEELPWYNGGISLAMFAWQHMMIGRSQQATAHVDWGRVLQHLPLRTMDRALGKDIPDWQVWMDHPLLDDFWRPLRLDDDFATLDLPALHLTGWFDGDQPGEMFFWDGMQRSPAARHQHLVVGPWDHAGVFKPVQSIRDQDYAPAAVVDVDQLHLQWFDHWLKGIDDGVMDQPRARWFATGTNTWHSGDSWPPPTTDLVLHLRSGGAANTSLGDGRLSPEAPVVDEPADVYSYDPADVAQFAAVDFFDGGAGIAAQPADARGQELRDDILVYTSEPLTEPVHLSGRPRIVLHAGSDCPDTDWVVGLADVDPTGRSIPLSRDEDTQEHVTQGGRLRARYREGVDREVWMEPGAVYPFAIEMRDISHVFKAGHRIRLVVMSWDFPHVTRNLNTDESIADGTTIRVATNEVHHSPGAASVLHLPVEG